VITVTDIYDGDGRKIGQIAKCDCSKNEWQWIDFIIGIAGALAALIVMVS
jgi:hypothetical protein